MDGRPATSSSHDQVEQQEAGREDADGRDGTGPKDNELDTDELGLESRIHNADAEGDVV